MSVTTAPEPGPPSILPPLAAYLEASSKRFAACLSTLNHAIQIDGVISDVSLHFVKFDPTNKEPKFGLLATCLAKHIVSYCLSAKTRKAMQSKTDFNPDEGELFMLARDYFRKIQDSGEVGELLLFFLLEAAFQAPQIVCKMELKTNPKDEVKGSDGIHIKWDDTDGHLDIYLGESKLYQDIGKAMTDALESIKNLNDASRLDDELHLATAHFKHLDDDLKQKVTGWMTRDTAESECHIIHACLIGWDWPQYGRLASERDQLFQEFEDQYKKYSKNIRDLLTKRFTDYPYRHLTFHFLFVPFASVADFRAAFYRVLLGTNGR